MVMGSLAVVSDKRRLHSVCVALMPREGEQVTETMEAGGRERMQSLDDLRGMIS